MGSYAVDGTLKSVPELTLRKPFPCFDHDQSDCGCKENGKALSFKLRFFGIDISERCDKFHKKYVRTVPLP